MSGPKVEPGQRYGRLTVVQQRPQTSEQRRRGVAVWYCRCDCGCVADVRSDRLTSGRTTSCGCFRAERARELGKERAGRAGSADSLVNNIEWNARYNGLYVLGIAHLDPVPSRRTYWCRCLHKHPFDEAEICGRIVEVEAGKLVYKHCKKARKGRGKKQERGRKSCGCAQISGLVRAIANAERTAASCRKSLEHKTQRFKDGELENDKLAESQGFEPAYQCDQVELRKLARSKNVLAVDHDDD